MHTHAQYTYTETGELWRLTFTNCCNTLKIIDYSLLERKELGLATYLLVVTFM